MQLFGYSWKPPAYNGAFFYSQLTIRPFSFFYLQLELFAYNFSFFTYNWSLLAYSGKVRLIRALRDCKQRSLTVSKKSSKSFPLIPWKWPFSLCRMGKSCVAMGRKSGLTSLCACGPQGYWCLLLTNTLFLQNWGFCEFIFWDGPYFSGMAL